MTSLNGMPRSAAGSRGKPSRRSPITLRAHVEVGTEAYDATARELPADERDAAYPKSIERAPVFAEYQAKTSRTIPLFELVRA